METSLFSQVVSYNNTEVTCCVLLFHKEYTEKKKICLIEMLKSKIFIIFYVMALKDKFFRPYCS